MTIPERIKNRRESICMSQDELARLVGYSGRSAISKIENGEREIRQSMIVKIAAALHTTPSYIMGWDDDDSPSTPAASPAYSREEQDVIEAYRGLSDEGKNMVCGMLHIRRTVVTKGDAGLPDSPTG